MKAEDLMTSPVSTCSPEASLEHATRIMWESDLGCVIVINADQEPVGIITDRDIAMAAYLQGVALRDTAVGSAMARALVTCSPRTSLVDLEGSMRAARIHRVPVVSLEGKVVGIVTLSDLARCSQSSPIRYTEMPGVAKTLAAVTERRQPAAAP